MRGMGSLSFSAPKLRAALLLAVTLATLSVHASFAQEIEVLPFQADNWAVNDMGRDLGFLWASPCYDHSNWLAGPAPLGYGGLKSVDEGTELQLAGPTIYYRRIFSIDADLSKISQALLSVTHDDGAVAYVNGIEIARWNVDRETGPVRFSHTAPHALEPHTRTVQIDPYYLVQGRNVLAVEVHQHMSDLSIAQSIFDASVSIVTGDHAPGNDDSRQLGAQAETGGASEPVIAVTESLSLSVSLISEGHVWLYNDQGVDLGTEWTAPGYDTSSWNSGAAQLGYGDGDEATRVSYGPRSSSKYMTTYFRTSFTIEEAIVGGTVQVDLLRDDGAVVYINGVEVVRSNMPASGAVLFSTSASSAVAGSAERQFYSYSVDAEVLQQGENVVCVEVHQIKPKSSDLSFEMLMEGTFTIVGPEAPTPTSTATSTSTSTSTGTSTATATATSTSTSTATATATSTAFTTLTATATSTVTVTSTATATSTSTATAPPQSASSTPSANPMQGSSTPRPFITEETEETLLPFGSVWKYHDLGMDLGIAWVEPSYDDSTWASGPAQLGYGDGDEATVVSFGPSGSSKHITTYFRTTFNVAMDEVLTRLTMHLQRDDGAVVYLNGEEAYRSNMPGAEVPITYTTTAVNALGGAAESAVHTFDVDVGLAAEGDNVIAVEIHQAGGSSSDISFDLQVDATVSRNIRASASRSPDPSTSVAASTTATTSPTVTATATATASPLPEGVSASASPRPFISVESAETFVNFGSVWKYFDSGVDLGSAWTTQAFDDSAWASGFAQLGYGDGDEATVVSFGPSASSKYITTYFRTNVNLEPGATVTSLAVHLQRDDGAVVYLNGVEVVRSNMPAAPQTISWSTLATSAISGSGETAVNDFAVDAGLLSEGDNVIAVEIHQSGGGSSDISFDMKVDGMVTRTVRASASRSTTPTQSVAASTTPTSTATATPLPDGASASASPRPFVTVETTDVLVAAGSTWKYLDTGVDLGSGWTSPTFDDSLWASGPAQLGYGDGDEATVVSFGPNSSNKYTTTYFRTKFSVASVSELQSAMVHILRDDGAVVHLNGVEVARSNMPTAVDVVYGTTAVTAVSGGDEDTFWPIELDVGAIQEGENVLCVEIHQSGAGSSDTSFDLSLEAQRLSTYRASATSSPVPTPSPVGVSASRTPLPSPPSPVSDSRVIRGPYLQSGTTSSVTIRWRTSTALSSCVVYALAGTTDFRQVCEDGGTLERMEHIVLVSGMMADTDYEYKLLTGPGGAVLSGPHRFRTSPETNTAITPTVRLWALGDAGTGTTAQALVRDAYKQLEVAEGKSTDIWMMLGDNAYGSGKDNEHQLKFFNVYRDFMASNVVWPVFGNHDGYTANSNTQQGPYYEIFNPPKNAEAGGEPSGTEAYYSFQYSHVHVIVLNSYDVNRDPTGPMLRWLERDLAVAKATPGIRWVVASLHHPPYTSGSHESDLEGDLRQIRRNIVPILEDAGVDLVFSGHSHSYERSYLMDGHYGLSSSLSSCHLINSGNGDSDGAYLKPEGIAAHSGAVYVVTGSAGKTEAGPLNHPAMHISTKVLGSFVLDISHDTLSARFLGEDGVVKDSFKIVKTSAQSPPPTCANPNPSGRLLRAARR